MVALIAAVLAVVDFIARDLSIATGAFLALLLALLAVIVPEWPPRRIKVTATGLDAEFGEFLTNTLLADEAATEPLQPPGEHATDFWGDRIDWLHRQQLLMAVNQYHSQLLSAINTYVFATRLGGLKPVVDFPQVAQVFREAGQDVLADRFDFTAEFIRRLRDDSLTVSIGELSKAEKDFRALLLYVEHKKEVALANLAARPQVDVTD